MMHSKPEFDPPKIRHLVAKWRSLKPASWKRLAEKISLRRQWQHYSHLFPRVQPPVPGNGNNVALFQVSSSSNWSSSNWSSSN